MKFNLPTVKQLGMSMEYTLKVLSGLVKKRGDLIAIWQGFGLSAELSLDSSDRGLVYPQL